MRRHLPITALAIGMGLLAGCAKTATPVAVLPAKPQHEGQEPEKIGLACTHTILWVFSTGDSHIREAKKTGGIEDIATVEVVDKAFLFDAFPFNVYQQQCTEVSGYS